MMKSTSNSDMSLLPPSIEESRTIFDTLTLLPNPTKSRDQRNSYIKYVVTCSTLSLLACASTAYGFNVWLLPVSLSLYGPQATYSMRNGMILYSFSCQSLMGGIIVEAFSSKIMKMNTGVACAAATITYPLGLVLSGLSLQYASGVAAEVGFFLSQCIVCGIGLAVAIYTAQIGIITWFKEIDRSSLGASLFGFFAGFWAMTFSFWGPALVSRFDIHTSFYITAAVIFIMTLPSIFLLRSPSEVPLQQGTRLQQIDAGLEFELKDGSDISSDEQMQQCRDKEGIANSPMLTRREFNRHPQAHIQFFVWIFTLTPGFAIKFTISPLMNSVFDASVKIQSTASYIFLFFYAISRLVTGMVVSHVKVFTVVMTSTITSFLCFFFVGAFVLKNLTSIGWMWGFITSNIVIASSLGAGKVCISLVSLELWGVNNMPRMIARLVFALTFAAFIGPLFIWLGLSYPSNIYLDSTLNSAQQKAELEQSVGIALLVLGVIGFAGFTGHLLCVKPHRPSMRRIGVAS